MRLRADPQRNHAYLVLDADAAVAERLTFSDKHERLAWGISLHFDAGGHLVGVEFEHADRKVPRALLTAGEGLRVEHDDVAGAAYVWLQSGAGVAETLAFGHEEHRAAWGINLDFGRPGRRLVGIEFARASLAPAALLAGAEPV